MSRSDKTTPWKVVSARGDCRKDVCGGGYPCSHLSISASLKAYKKKHIRSERTKVRSDLAHGVEPLNNQHRHSALWEAV